jgi:hypothetical protein
MFKIIRQTLDKNMLLKYMHVLTSTRQLYFKLHSQLARRRAQYYFFSTILIQLVIYKEDSVTGLT